MYTIKLLLSVGMSRKIHSFIALKAEQFGTFSLFDQQQNNWNLTLVIGWLSQSTRADTRNISCYNGNISGNLVMILNNFKLWMIKFEIGGAGNYRVYF